MGESRRVWELPEDVSVEYVDSEERLQQLSEVLGAALCCAIDAEWPPEETTEEAKSGGPPHATLVQLALWLPPSCSLPADRGRQGCTGCCCVVLLDLMRLPQNAAKQALQALIRCQACLKLGFGMVHDLRAIAAALGSEGGSCIAVVEPACDLGSLHRFLRHRGVRGVYKAVDLGLSGLVEAQLGQPLDKQLQCSAWGRRPLSAGQLRYAAADAACLLALLVSFVAAVGQPEEWPMVDADSRCGSSSRHADPEPAAAAGQEGAAAEEEEEGGLEMPSGAAAAQRGVAAAVARTPQQQVEQQQQPKGAALLGGCSLQQLQAAAAAWGMRLELSGAHAVKRSSKRGGKARRGQRQAAAAAHKLPPGCSGFPLHVPWADAQGRLTAPPRFLVDTMAEGLAKQLRLCGFDAESLQGTMEKAPRHAIYRAMVERGEAEGRLVLTRDRTFVSAAFSDHAFLVTADTKRQQLEQVLGAFGLQVQRQDLLTRCAHCNGEFLPEPLATALLPEGHAVPPGIQEQHKEFWVCSRCGAVFWQGTQYFRAMGQMSDLISRLGLQGTAPEPSTDAQC